MASIDRGTMPDCRTRNNTLALEIEFIYAEVLRLQNGTCGSTTTRMKWDLQGGCGDSVFGEEG